MAGGALRVRGANLTAASLALRRLPLTSPSARISLAAPASSAPSSPRSSASLRGRVSGSAAEPDAVITYKTPSGWRHWHPPVARARPPSEASCC